MDLFESHTHSFVIKIWLEETAEEAGEVVWRGQIDHVPSGRRTYFLELEDITFVILSYLKKMGVNPPWWWKAKEWLKQRRPSNR